ncbi:MAG TPA: RNA polymerase sigma factor [Polyangiaceae bacterium]|jgi:RNA polymerase sigma-70 factor (ECF subfamily)
MAARSEATDEMLMVRYQRGDRQAFAELLSRYEAQIYNFSLRQLRQAGNAEDVTQEVFLRVVQKAAEFKHEARFSTWLYTIARNLCIDELRKYSHRRHASLDQPGPSEGGERTLGEQVPDLGSRSNVERNALSSEVQRRILEAVDELPDEQREVFLLRQLADLPFKEIAAATGVGENTVKSRLRYALDRLQQALGEFEEYARALR